MAVDWDQMRQQAAVWAPVSGPWWLAPAVTLGALLALVILSGVALASLGLLLTVLLVAHLLLENVFGVSIGVALPR